MREIEFRGKIKETGEWVYGTLLRKPAPPQCIGNKKPDTYFIQFPDPRYTPDWNMPYSMVQAEVIPETIGQYTGLKDKNGKKIFEGDIIKFIYENKERIRAIVFEKGEFLAKDDTTAFGPTFRHIRLCSNIEVIGNIWENGDLLKED